MVDIPSDLNEVAARIRRHLTRARADRHHPMRLAWVATVGLAGGARTRMAVVRRTRFAPVTVTLFTDTRARKWAEIGANPGGSLALFDRKAMEQLRLGGTWRRQSDTAVTRPLWEGQGAAAQALYASQPPGAPIARQASDRGPANGSIRDTAVTGANEPVIENWHNPQYHVAISRLTTGCA